MFHAACGLALAQSRQWSGWFSASAKPQAAGYEEPVFHTKRRIEFGDTDMAGIVHFSNFFRFMESAECEFLRSRGLSVKLDWEGQAIGFPRVSASCDYVSPARFEDVLDVAVSIERIGAKSVTYAFEFTRGGAVIA